MILSEKIYKKSIKYNCYFTDISKSFKKSASLITRFPGLAGYDNKVEGQSEIVQIIHFTLYKFIRIILLQILKWAIFGLIYNISDNFPSLQRRVEFSTLTWIWPRHHQNGKASQMRNHGRMEMKTRLKIYHPQNVLTMGITRSSDSDKYVKRFDNLIQYIKNVRFLCTTTTVLVLVLMVFSIAVIWTAPPWWFWL